MVTSFAALRKVCGLEFAIQTPRWEDDDFNVKGGRRQYLSGTEILQMVSQFDGWDAIRGGQTVEEIVSGVMEFLHESEIVSWVGTKAEAEALEADEERRSIENHAAAFAKRSKTTAGSRQFVIALKKAMIEFEERIKIQNGYEAKAERWMEARFCGTDFWADEDYLGERALDEAEALDKVLQWLTKNCPLLVASVEEEFLRNAKE
jgi:hypothetical protein